MVVAFEIRICDGIKREIAVISRNRKKKLSKANLIRRMPVGYFG
jgi:hypothetical protein